MKLITKRLILRKPTLKDTKDLVENINNLKVSRYLAVVPHPYFLKDAKWFISNCSKAWNKKQKEKYVFAIELKSTKKIIGVIDLNKINRWNGTATFGYWLGEKYWKQGFMTEAFQKVIEFAFNKLKLRKLEVFAYTKNKGSNTLIKKMGFKLEGLQRKNIKSKATGKIKDSYFYGLLKEEWKR